MFPAFQSPDRNKNNKRKKKKRTQPNLKVCVVLYISSDISTLRYLNYIITFHYYSNNTLTCFFVFFICTHFFIAQSRKWTLKRKHNLKS